MVNTGRPSTGCATCKKRKIKCDERRPHCMRCERIGKECPGVPAPLDFVFRPGKGVSNSNGRQIARSSSSKSSKSIDSARGRTRSYDSATPSPDYVFDPCVYQPTLSLENQGVAIFFQDFVMAPQNAVLGNFMTCLPSVYGTASSTSPLRYAVAANAISSLRCYLGRPSLWGTALYYYGQALEAMREAMGDGKRVQGDDVLMTVMLLKLFENQVGSAKSLTGYEYHTTAAAALLVKRGTTQFANASSLRLFRTVRWHIFMASMQSSRYPNSLYSGFDWFADRNIPDEDADGSALAAAAFELPRLRCRAAAVLSQPDHQRASTDVHDLLRDAERIDAELLAWRSGPRSSRAPAACSTLTEPDADAWAGIALVFDGALAALHANTFHLARILANGIALRAAALLAAGAAAAQTSTAMALPSSSAPLVEACTANLQDSVDGVCASVPWHLGYGHEITSASMTGDVNGFETWQQQQQQQSMMEAEQLASTRASHLVWPLFLAMSVHVVPLAQRQWCARKLRDVGAGYGLKHAEGLAGAFRL